jgi:hypothetical protein
VKQLPACRTSVFQIDDQNESINFQFHHQSRLHIRPQSSSLAFHEFREFAQRPRL